MEQLATQNRTAFAKLKQWFYRNVIKTSEQTTVLGTKAAQRKTYALMLRAEKAAMSQSNNNENTIKYSVNSKYQTLLDNWDGKTTGFSFLLGTTSKALQEAGIPDRQIKIDATKLKTALSKHNGMTIDIFKQLPDMLENPIVVLDSKRDEDSRIVIGDLYDEHGKPVTAVLFLNPTSRKGNALDLIKVSSAEGRSHIRSLFFKEDGTNVAVRYADKNRAQEWLNANRLQLPLHSTTLDSNNSISDSAENVNGNISYSAKKPEIIDKLKADYGYSEASANNIYRAARTLKQNTGSTADVEQLTSAIVTSLENRKNGDIDSKNIERIAMMLAEDAKAINEDFIAENKPILDRLNGMTISISEADISDLGDAFFLCHMIFEM